MALVPWNSARRYWNYSFVRRTYTHCIACNLPKLHEMIKDQMPPARKGLWGAYKEIIPALFKQAKDPKHQIPLAIPN